MASQKEFRRTDGDLFIEAIETLWDAYKRKSKKDKQKFLVSLECASRYARKKGLREIVLTAIEEMERDYFGKRNAEQPQQKASGVSSCYKITTNSLECYGIYQDEIIVTMETAELDESALMMFDVGEECKTGFGFENFGDISIIRNGEVVARENKDKVKIRGKITGVVKPIIAKPTDRIETTKEIKISCSDCKRTGEGSEGFLKAQGWDLKRKLCLKCDLL